MKIDLITPSYAPDFDRCKVLCESIETYVTGIENHFLVVDRQDRELFSPLESTRCSVVVKEEILPSWLHHLPWSRKWWLSERTIPVRGWILQQIVKLSVAEWSQADVFMFADSDVFFVRPFDARSTLKDDRVRLFRTPKKGEDHKDRRHKHWDHHAARLFSLQGNDHCKFDYISQLNTWRRDVLIKLLERIEEGTGMPWKQALCNQLHFSEYVIYGVFVDRVLGTTDAGHYLDWSEICNCSWHQVIDGQQALNRFINRTLPNQSAVLVQSNLNAHPDTYSHMFHWSQISNP